MGISDHLKTVRITASHFVMRKQFFRDLYLRIKKEELRKEMLHHDKLLFIHVPKNGGTSVRAALGNVQGRHVKISEIIRNNILTKEELEERLIFGVVRNPFSRFVSLYEFFQDTDHEVFKNGVEWKQLNKQISGLTFEEFVDKYDTFHKKHPVYFGNQTDYITSKGLSQPPQVLHLESLQEEFNEFGKTYNLPPLPHKNVSKKVRSNWRDMYNQETAKRVYEIYQEDCDVWYPEAYLDLQKHIEEVKPS